MRIVSIIVLLIPIVVGAQPVKSKSSGAVPQPAMHEADNAPSLANDASLFMSETSSGAYWLERYTQKRNEFLLGDGMLSAAETSSLNTIIKQAAQQCSASFEYHYMLCRQARNTSVAPQHLKNAIQAGSGHVLLHAEEAWIAERKGDKKALNAAMASYLNKGGLSPAQVQAAKWTLEVAPAEALIITHGEFDTYGLWYAGNGQRHVLSLAMIEDRTWLQNKISAWDKNMVIPASAGSPSAVLAYILSHASKPVYLSLGMRPELLQTYSNQLFPIGPVALYSGTNTDLFDVRRNLYLSGDFKRKLNSINTGDPYAAALSNLLPAALALKNESDRLTASDLTTIKQIIKQISQISGKRVPND
jgi:hypothetical protein